MDIQRLRNLTTGKLHTKMEDIYKDLGMITGEDGLVTHMLPRAIEAIEPWLREKVTDQRFWNNEFDTTHIGEFDLPETTSEERKVFFDRFVAMPNPLDGKEVIAVVE